LLTGIHTVRSGDDRGREDRKVLNLLRDRSHKIDSRYVYEFTHWANCISTSPVATVATVPPLIFLVTLPRYRDSEAVCR
jgi:hypothetical protein